MKKRWLLVFIPFAAAYVVMPYIAGAFEIGSRRGPIIYSASYHRELFILGCESHRGYKPREGFYQSLYERACFYGLDERPKSQKEREEIINGMIERGLPPSLIERVQAIHEELKTKAPNQALQTTTRSSPTSTIFSHIDSTVNSVRVVSQF